jgi:hypothetical protein
VESLTQAQLLQTCQQAWQMLPCHISHQRATLLMQKLSILARNCKALIRQTLSRKEVGEVSGGRGAQHTWI